MMKETSIYILFEDEDIRIVFSELLQALGQRTYIVSNLNGIPDNASIVTEPRFYQELLPNQKTNSLVIGNKEALKKIDTPTLSRPLTEEKIDQALSILLNRA